MIIDDNKIDLFVSQKIIEKTKVDCDVKTFTTARSALHFFKNLESKKSLDSEYVPNVVLLDINMPEISGFQFLKEFNKFNKVNNIGIRIYMLSSSANVKDITEAENEKFCSGFLSKPLSLDKLNAIIVKFKPFLKIFDSEADDINLIKKII